MQKILQDRVPGRLASINILYEKFILRQPLYKILRKQVIKIMEFFQGIRQTTPHRSFALIPPCSR